MKTDSKAFKLKEEKIERLKKENAYDYNYGLMQISEIKRPNIEVYYENSLES